MRKTLKIIISTLLCGLLLSACGNNGGDEGLLSRLKIVPDFNVPEIPEEESLKMASFMSGGRAWISDNKLYCMDFDENLEPVLASYSIDEGALSDFTVLTSDCVPEFLTEYQGRLYFINSRSNRDIESVACDGSDSRIVKAGPCDFLKISGDKIYYCDSKNRLYSMAADGSAESTVLPEACFYPYVIDDVLIYQRASDERIHMMELLSGADTELTDLPSYAPVIWGDKFFCTVSDGIYSMGLDGLELVKFTLPGIQGEAQYCRIGGKPVICGSVEYEGLCSWMLSADEPKDSFRLITSGSYRLLEHAGEEYAVFSEYEAGGRFRCFILTGPDGSERIFFAGTMH